MSEPEAVPAEAAPRAPWLSRLRGRSLEDWFQITEIAAKIGLAGAAIFAIVQYRDAQEARRVERAMTYIDMFERGEIAEARRALNAALRPYQQQFAELAKQGGVSADDKKAIILTLMEGDEGVKLADSLDRMVDFYEGVRLCEAEKLCASSVVDGYFCPGRANGLWSDFRPYAESRRANNPEYGAALQSCAETPRRG